MTVALAAHDEALAARAKADLAASIRPVSGQLCFVDGSVRAFADLVDADDAIGQMLELFVGDGVLYVPFAAARRVAFQPATNLLDFRMIKTVVTLRDDSVATGVVPLLYAGSSTDPDAAIRSGKLTWFEYVGGGRRARGERDFFADRTMIGRIELALEPSLRAPARGPVGRWQVSVHTVRSPLWCCALGTGRSLAAISMRSSAVPVLAVKVMDLAFERLILDGEVVRAVVEAAEDGAAGLALDGDASIVGHTLVLHDDKKGQPGKALACGPMTSADEPDRGE
jgi:hypothetical protein